MAVRFREPRGGLAAGSGLVTLPGQRVATIVEQPQLSLSITVMFISTAEWSS